MQDTIVIYINKLVKAELKSKFLNLHSKIQADLIQGILSEDPKSLSYIKEWELENLKKDLEKFLKENGKKRSVTNHIKWAVIEKFLKTKL